MFENAKQKEFVGNYMNPGRNWWPRTAKTDWCVWFSISSDWSCDLLGSIL